MNNENPEVRADSDQPAQEFAETWRGAMVRYAQSMLGSLEAAEDAAQEILVRALHAEAAPDEVRPWLYRIARNHCLNLLRADRARPGQLPSAGHSALASPWTGHLTRIVREERHAQLSERLLELTIEQREVLHLRYGESLSRVEIAAVLGVPEPVAKSRLFEAMQKLRELTKDLA